MRAAELVGDVIEDAFGLRVGVIARSAAELAAVAGRQPVPRAAGASSTRRRCTSPSSPSSRPQPRSRALDPDRSPPDAFAVEGREVYLSYPSGSGRSRLTLDYLERALGVPWHGAQLADGAAARRTARGRTDEAERRDLLLTGLRRTGRSSSCSCTWAGRSGREKTPAPGRSRRGRSRTARTRSRSRGASSRRSSARRPRRSSSSTWARSRRRTASDVAVFAGEADFDADERSAATRSRWSGREAPERLQEFPEIDRAAWVGTDEARGKLVRGQVEFVDRLVALLALPSP